MTPPDIEQAIREIMSVVLRRPLGPDEDVRRESEPTWDSLKHVELLFAVEGALEVTFDPGELPDLDSLKKFVASVEAHRAS
jgi:acyl carrier protein